MRLDSPQALHTGPHYQLNWTEDIGWHRNPAGRSELPIGGEQSPEAIQEQRFAALLAEAAHDIRSPIATAQQIVGAVADRASVGRSLSEEDVQLLRSAMTRLAQANRWAEGILLERHLSQQLPTSIRRRFYPHQWRNSMEPLLAGLAARHNIRLAWVGWDRSMPRLYVDPDHLSRVVLNLVSNAVEASQPASQVSIRIAWQTNVTQRLVLAIEDSGLGLDPQLMRQINSGAPWPERLAGTGCCTYSAVRSGIGE